MKILLLDIETAPMLGYSWDIWKEQGSMKFIVKDWYMLCWCVKWLDDKKVISRSLPDFKEYKKDKTFDRPLVSSLWEILNQADVVVTQNGVKFDIPKINAKFIEHGIAPVSPFKSVDTCLIARKIFGFSSNKLDDLGKILNVGVKIETGGFDLWKECINGNLKAWKKMVRYCSNDVLLLEKVYKKMLPFISSHPNRNIFDGTRGNCPKCGSNHLVKRGERISISGKKQQYQCKECGGWCVEGSVIKNG